MPKDNMGLRGAYAIEAVDPATGEILRRWELANQLTAVNQNVRDQMLLGTFAGPLDALQIKYIGLGTDSTPAAVSDTQLGAEQYRRAVTQIAQSGAGSIKTVLSIPPAEANFRIREIGVFCGPGASDAANTGTLLSRVVVDIENNANITLNIVRYDVCSI